MSIIDHFEKFLGQIKQGWQEKNVLQTSQKIMIARFSDAPFHGVSSYSTIGLSDCPLFTKEGIEIKQELIFSAYDTYSPESIAAFLLSFSDFMRSQSGALARGDVVGPSAPLIPGIMSNAIYACSPTIFPDGIDIYKESLPPVIIVWLVPLVGKESSLAKQSNRENFENFFENKDPDIFDLNRASVTE